MSASLYDYWSQAESALFEHYQSGAEGLSHDQAASRLLMKKKGAFASGNRNAALFLFFQPFKSPIILILLGATLVSAMTGDITDSIIILLIVLISSMLTFFQEYRANQAVRNLRQRLHVETVILRDGVKVSLPAEKIVSGDIMLLYAGSLIPADGRILTCQHFYVDQSLLTGEAFPVEKESGVVPATNTLSERTNCVWAGTNVRSGNASVLVTVTGADTAFGTLAKKLTLRPPETEFERGVRHFGYLLSEIMLSLTLVILAVNVINEKSALDSLLFSVALAVGITPQMLPAIINIALSRGARIMAKEDVIVRRLSSVENFGSMDTLCTDKTGTLTKGVIQLDGAVNVEGNESDDVLRMAYFNAYFQTGMQNPLDSAILSSKQFDVGEVEKISEIPYDFMRKRLSITIKENGALRLLVKGSFEQVLECSSYFCISGAKTALTPEWMDKISQRVEAWNDQGFRVLGVASKELLEDSQSTAEKELTFQGFLLFFDPPRQDVINVIDELETLGIKIRIITGDSQRVALHIAHSVGLKIHGSLTGHDIQKMSDQALWHQVVKTTLFSEVDPNQKERIILAFKKNNHVVGYMGDGINDVPALHAADVSISVNSAVDVAKESADFVLMSNSLEVLKRGIELGRQTFSNTLKYIFITTSANLGNMISMAGASIFMPFLPLLPKQILVINFLSDLPALTLASDHVDAAMLKKPRRWDIRLIRRFMLTFGLISSIFDYLAFWVLLVIFKSGPEQFRTGWFVLSVLTELMVLIIMRTSKPFFKSRPSGMLITSTILIAVLTIILPYWPLFQNPLSIRPLPAVLLGAIVFILFLYSVATEIAKHWFYRK